MVDIKQNLIPNEPDLADLMEYVRKDINLSLNCHHIGTIKSFNSVNQTATINYKKTFLKFFQVGGYKSVSVDYPLAFDCPVVIMSGGDGALTFPITEGDECLIIFNDRDIDNWFAGSSESETRTLRTHSFADALILVGVRSLRNVITPYETDAVTLKKGNNSIKVYDDRVEVSLGLAGIVSLVLNDDGTFSVTNATGEIVSALSQLFDDIAAATTTTMLGPQPLVMPTFTADKAIFDTFKA